MNSIENENTYYLLNQELFNEVRKEKILSYNLTSNNGKNPESYKGVFRWDMEKLNDIPLEKDQVNKIIQFLNPKDNISWIEAQELMDGDPNTLITTMTLFAHNYAWVCEEIKEKSPKHENPDEFSKWEPKFLFTEDEKTIIYTGRTLLKELNETLESEYINHLVSEIDDIIILFNDGLVGEFVQKFKHLIPYNDLFQEGRRGILRALEDYDVRTGNKFSTYASWWIEQRIRKYIAKNYNPLKLPNHMHDAVNRFLKIKGMLITERKKEVTDEEVLEYCEKNNVDLPYYKEHLFNAINQRNSTSLDAELSSDEESSSLSDVIPSSENVEETVINNNLDDLLKKMIVHAGLNDREEFILSLRFGFTPNYDNPKKDNYTLQEIAHKLDITRERVRQIQNKALKKLRRAGIQFQEYF